MTSKTDEICIQEAGPGWKALPLDEIGVIEDLHVICGNDTSSPKTTTTTTTTTTTSKSTTTTLRNRNTTTTTTKRPKPTTTSKSPNPPIMPSTSFDCIQKNRRRPIFNTTAKTPEDCFNVCKSIKNATYFLWRLNNVGPNKCICQTNSYNYRINQCEGEINSCLSPKF